MKFVCDNCQAKYQIGDDKVAGKTVRMKCRKCGYNIKVSPAGIVDAPTIDAPSHEVEAPASLQRPGPAQAAPAPPRPAAAPLAAAPPSGPQSAWEEDDGESTSIMNAPVRDAVAALTGGGSVPRPAPSGPRPVTAAPPRPATAAPRPYAPPGRTVPGVGSAAAAAPRPVSRTASSAAIAAVQPEPAPHHPPEDWYVGIAGSPIGPVGVSVIRERAAVNEVDGESLVWREGMAEWRPLRTFPELFEVVTAVQAPPPPPAPVSLLETPKPAAPPAPPAPPAPIAAAPVAPIVETPKPAVPPAPLVMGDPFASPFGAGPGAPASAVPPDAPPAPAPAQIVPKPSSADIDPAVEEALIPRRRGGTHPMAYAFIAAAAVFGGVAAWVLLKPPPPPQVVIVTAPGGNAVPTATATAAPDERSQPQVEVGDLTTTNSARPIARAPGPMPKSSATGSTPAAPIDTSSFVNNVPGPAANGPSAPAGGGTLSAGEIQGVVQQNQAMVKRKCWQPALEGAAANAPKTARVNGAITIGPSGSVESASANGAERDYPGLSSCIATRMKNWKFPASGGSQQVNVPFVFAGQ